MKLTHYQDQLILQDSPTSTWLAGWGACILGLLSMILGLFRGSDLAFFAIFFFSGVFVTLMGCGILRRTYAIINTFSPRQLEVAHKSLRGEPRLIATYPLTEIEAAAIGVEEAEGTEYYVFLRMRSGKNVSLLAKYSGSQKKMLTAASAIQNFLESNRKTD